MTLIGPKKEPSSLYIYKLINNSYYETLAYYDKELRKATKFNSEIIFFWNDAMANIKDDLIRRYYDDWKILLPLTEQEVIIKKLDVNLCDKGHKLEMGRREYKGEVQEVSFCKECNTNPRRTEYKGYIQKFMVLKELQNRNIKNG